MRPRNAFQPRWLRLSLVAGALAVLLGACESGPEDLCEDLGWDPGSPQYEDCMRRAGGRGDEEYAPTSGPRKKNQRGF